MKKISVAGCVFIIFLASCSTSPGSVRTTEKRGGPFTDKRGVSYSFEQDKTYAEDMALLAPAVKWFYNWYIQPHPDVEAARKEHNVLYYPMVWNNWDFEAMLEEYLAKNPDIDFIMGYNEPNLRDQCNYTPKEAAKYWPKLVKFAKNHNLKIIAPGMNYGTLENYWVPFVWLDEFFGIDSIDENTGKTIKNKGFKDVSLDDIDVIAVHCYMPGTGALKGFINQFKRYGKPIWLSEFCSWEYSQPNAAWQNLEYQMNFMSEAVTYLELDPDVEKYAWFIPKGSEDETAVPANKLLTKTVPPENDPPQL
ncbi:MAG: glycoside hydrolase family protein, partial [Treponema sp.]|nr:glycoside hydrolase family protein [Treponema sp.]